MVIAKILNNESAKYQQNCYTKTSLFNCLEVARVTLVIRGLNMEEGVPQLAAEGGAQSVLLRDGFLDCMAPCSVRSSWEAVLVNIRPHNRL